MRDGIIAQGLLTLHTIFHFDHNWLWSKGHISCACGYLKDKVTEELFEDYKKVMEKK